jgi:hypothetical protein
VKGARHLEAAAETVIEEHLLAVVERLLRAPKLVGLVGAGISNRRPSGLPLGPELSAGLIEASAGSKFADELRKLYRHFEGIGLPRSFPRPEMILEVLYRIGGVGIFQSLGFMSQVPPNPNHYSLAALAGRGGAIFTTNFDLLLEAAAASIGCLAAAHDRIHHLHGRIDDCPSLRATISGITRPLDESEATRLQTAISDADVVVVAGYSASDVFDITPVLREAFLEARGELVWLQHRDVTALKDMQSDQGEEVPKQVEELLKLWQGPRRLIVAPTGKVFDAVLGKMGLQPSGQEMPMPVWKERLGLLMGNALERIGGKELVPLAFADLVGCGELALAYGSVIDSSALQTVRQRLLCRRYSRSGWRITGQYAHAVRQSVGSAVLALRSCSLLDLVEELYAINYEWRVYGQKDPCVALASTAYLSVPSAILRIYLLGVRKVRRRLPERVLILRYRDGAYWAFMWWLLKNACEHGARNAAGSLLQRVSVPIYQLLARAFDRLRGRVTRRIRLWRVWLPDDRVTFLLTLPEKEELDLLMGESEQLLASVNRVRSQREEELDRLTEEEGSRRALMAWREDVRKLRTACRALGDKPGELKATVLLARGSDVVGDREGAKASRKEAEALLAKIRWSRGARRYWLRQIRHYLQPWKARDHNPVAAR